MRSIAHEKGQNICFASPTTRIVLGPFASTRRAMLRTRLATTSRNTIVFTIVFTIIFTIVFTLWAPSLRARGQDQTNPRARVARADAYLLGDSRGGLILQLGALSYTFNTDA